LPAPSSSADLVEVLEALPDAFYTVDREWHLTYVNRRAAELWRRPRETLIGRCIWDLFPRAVGSTVWADLHRSMSAGFPVERETLSAVLDEWIELRATPIRGGLLVHFRQIADRKRREAEYAAAIGAAHRAAEHAALLQMLTAELSVAVSEEQVSSIVLRQALPAFGATAGDVVLLSDDGREFRALCWVGYPEEVTRPWMRYSIDAGTPAADVVRTGAPVFLESDQAWQRFYPRIAPIIRANALSAFAGLPIEFEGRVRGVVCFNFPGPRSFSDNDRAMFLTFAGQCAQALERARLFEAEQRSRAEAEAANRAKSEFLAVMSHELRTPLTAILGYQELLADGLSGPVTEMQHQQLERIKASALHLLQLIEELLTFSRLEAGRETVQPITVPVASLLDDATALIAPLAAAKRLTLTVTAPPSAHAPPPHAITTDPGKVRQVLVNLLSNAVKFTERGNVVLHAFQDGAHVVFEVHDTGIGIAAEYLERIFEPFWQIEQQATRRVGGTGLGLSVSRALVHLLGGTLTVTSALGKGSTFRVRLPVRA
jgi:signal transduction histidine kinase